MENINVNPETELGVETILKLEVLELPTVISPQEFQQDLKQKCKRMTILEFLKLGFPQELLEIYRVYREARRESIIRTNRSVLSFVTREIKTLPTVKAKRRLV